jgi:hypothetical protein
VKAPSIRSTRATTWIIARSVSLDTIARPQ